MKPILTITCILLMTACGSQNIASSLKDGEANDQVALNSTMIVSLSKTLLEKAGFAKHVNEVTPFNKYQFGARVWGQAHQTGNTYLELRPNNHQAQIDTLYQARTITSTTGNSEGVTFWSTTTTNSHTRKQMIMSNGGFQYPNAISNVNSSLHYRGANTNRAFRRIVLKKAWQRLRGNQRRAEQATTNEVVQAVHQRMNRDIPQGAVDGGLSKLWHSRKELAIEGGLGNRAHFSTSSHALRMVVRKQEGQDLSAIPMFNDTDLHVRIHQSTMNELMHKYFSGQQATQAEIDAKLGKLFDIGSSLGNSTPSPSDEDKFAVKFAKNDPIKVSIDGGIMKIAISGEQFVSKNKTHYYPMVITAQYKQEGNKLIKLPESVEALPPGFDPDNDSMTLKQKVLSKILKKHFAAKLDDNLATPIVKVAGRVDLHISQVIINEGWLAMAWKTRR